MLYSWKCKCGEITEVVRSMKDIDVPPDACETCGHMDLVRTIIVDSKSKNFVLNGSGWHNDQYTKTRSRN